MTDPTSLHWGIVLGGFATAFVFGYVGNATRFCTMGAVADIVSMRDWRRMRMWLLAIAVALVGASALHSAGLVNLDASIYARPHLLWASHIAGGLLFGIGMTLAGGCGSRTLIRLGGGSLKALIVLTFLGIAAYMTLRGMFAVLRVNSVERFALALAEQGYRAQDLASLAGQPQARMSAALAIAAALSFFVFRDREFRAAHGSIIGGISIGMCVVAAWLLTGKFGYGENPETLEMIYFATNSRGPESLTFVAPAGYLLELLLLYSDASLRMTFGIASVLGVTAGSFVYALASKRFRWEGFADTADLRNHIVGALLMGVGGITALGCTIGQGISGVSTLAIGSIITLLAIVTGSALTLRWMYARL